MNRKFARVAIEGEHPYLKRKISVPPGYRNRTSDVANYNVAFAQIVAKTSKK